MKFFPIILLIFTFYSTIESNMFDFKTIGLYGQSAVNLTGSVIKKIPDFIPSPQELFEGGKNLIAGYPFEVVFSTVNTFCGAALSSESIKPLITPNIDHMRFVLKVKNQNLSVPLKSPEKLWLLPEFNPQLPLIFMITGWTTNFNDSTNPTLDKIYAAYQCRGNYNFVTVDPAAFVDTLYTWSAFNTEEIGKLIADSLAILINTYPIENIHLIGHSLGAHIAGSAGRNLFYKTGKQVPRITGLDPANPCFNPGETLTGLSRGDADFVLVIHSNSGGLGKRDPLDIQLTCLHPDILGDADFYPNGVQPLPPGCYSITCAHQRAPEFYAESVYPGNEHNFVGVKCGSLTAYNAKYCPGSAVPMGYGTPNNAKGNFFLKTNGESPFGLNATKNTQLVCNNIAI